MEDLQLSLYDLTGALSLFAALLYSVQIATIKSGQNHSNRWVALFLCLIALIIAFFLVFDLGFMPTAQLLIPLFNFALLSIGPTLWLYVQSLTKIEQQETSLRAYMPAFFVGVLSLFILAVILILPEDSTLKEALVSILIYVTVGSMTGIFLIQNGYYIYRSHQLYNKHQYIISNIFSYSETVGLKWLRIMVYGYIGFIACMILVHIPTDLEIATILFNLTMLAYVVFVGYNAVKQVDIYNDLREKNYPTSNEENDTNHDNQNKVQLDKTILALKPKLLDLMNNEKPYLDQNLNIQQVAELLNTNSKYLSQLINQELNETFINLINRYRIEEARILLSDKKNENLTIEGIGQSAGFKSKSAFNTAFKKHTGTTPSAFKMRQ